MLNYGECWLITKVIQTPDEPFIKLTVGFYVFKTHRHNMFVYGLEETIAGKVVRDGKIIYVWKFPK